jgi:hypothetical protein
MQPFSKSWFLAVTYEEPVGNPVETASVQLELSDLPRGAEALADAQMGKDSRPHTQRIPGRSSTEVEPMVDFGVTVDGWLGGGGGSFGGGGFATGATGLVQYKWLDAGLGASLRSGLFTPTTSFVSGLAGVRIDPVSWFRIDLLAETGAQMMSGAGTSIFSGTLRGGSATLPYLGGRVGLSFLIGRSHRFVLGLWAILGSSLGHQNTLATVETCFFGCDVTTNTYSVGGSTFMTGLRLGAFIH